MGAQRALDRGDRDEADSIATAVEVGFERLGIGQVYPGTTKGNHLWDIEVAHGADGYIHLVVTCNSRLHAHIRQRLTEAGFRVTTKGWWARKLVVKPRPPSD